MRKLAVLVLAVVVIAVVAAPQAAWALIIVVRVQNAAGNIAIEGESAVAGHEKEIDVLAVSFGVSNPTTGAGGGGGGAGKATFSDISLAKRVDKASPLLFLAVATGQHYPLVRIEFLDEAKKSLVPVFTIELKDAFFTSFQFAGGGSGLDESISLNFSKITLKHNASGTTATWDSENKQ